MTFEEIQKNKIRKSYWNSEITKSDTEKSPKFKKVMEEYKNGTLRSSNGDKVVDRSQAVAIAYSEAEKGLDKSEDDLGGEMVKSDPDKKDSKQNTEKFVGGEELEEYQKGQQKEKPKDPEKEDSDKVTKSELDLVLEFIESPLDIEKAVYADNYKNRKLNRVGQQYGGGSKAAEKGGDGFKHNRLMAGYYGIKEKEALDSGGDLSSSSDPELRKEAKKYYDRAKKYGEKSNKHMERAKKLFDPKKHGSWNSTTPTENEANEYGNNSSEGKNNISLKKDSEGSFTTSEGEKINYRAYSDGWVKMSGSNMHKQFENIQDAEKYISSLTSSTRGK